MTGGGPAGSEPGTRKYDVFGEVRSSTGSASTEFLFAGEQRDAAVGLTYLRARYYDATTGRFVSKDPFGGWVKQPQTANKYVYAGNDPVNETDRVGLFAGPDPGGEACQGLNPYDCYGGPLGPIGTVAAAAAGQAIGEMIADYLKSVVSDPDRIESHHLLPRQPDPAEYFRNAGLNIDDAVIDMKAGDHRFRDNDGLHTGSDSWNKQWEDYKQANPSANAQQITEQLKRMMGDSGKFSEEEIEGVIERLGGE